MLCDGLCTPCLIGVNANMAHGVWQPRTLPEGVSRSFIPVSEGPRAIAAWHEEIMQATGGDAVFVTGPTPDTLTAVAVLAGTPMCTGHLWDYLGDMTRRERWRP